MRAYVKDIYRDRERYDGQEVTVSGWIRTLRASNKFGFIELNDGTFFESIQVVLSVDELENFEEVAKYPIATAIHVTGELVLTPDAKQPFEIKATEVVLEGLSDNDYPLQKKRHTFEYMRSIAHLRP